ncbi:MAG: aminotransferase class V-fold PLP-dependent enzyme [Halopseudomonas sp.]
MPVIYFDHGATSWPKPAAVREALDEYLLGEVGSPGRSGHRMSIRASQRVEETRELLARLFNIADPVRIAFTQNATEALNLAIYGLLRPGDHVVTTSVEHNSVMRPLRHLSENGVALTVVPCASDGTLVPESIRQAVRDDTKLIVTTHGSNVVGSLLPVAKIGQIAREYGVPFLVDAAQTAGSVPIDVETLGIDLLAFTGHKALLGLTGTGGLYVREGIHLNPLIRGGTGSDSELESQPDFMPDKYESGTVNVAGLVGLGAAVRHVLRIGVERIRAHEQALAERFIRGCADIPKVRLYGPRDSEQRGAVVAFNIDGLVPSEVGLLLEQHYGIYCRVGLHCAPGAHRTLGTLPAGTVRFSFGYSNTLADIDTALAALKEISTWCREEGENHG